MNGAKILGEVIAIETGGDIYSTSRIRVDVEARGIFGKIMRDVEGWTFLRIGKFVGRNHATVMHSINVVTNVMERDPIMRDGYVRCLNRYLNDEDPLKNLSPYMLRKKIYGLDRANHELNAYILRLKEELRELKAKRADKMPIYELIEEKLPSSKVDIATKKLNVILNGL